MRNSMIGLKSGTVHLVKYQKVWSKIYSKERTLIKDKLNDYIIDIQHIGSTAIPNSLSKPVIDIAISVKKISIVEQCIAPLFEIEYDYRGESNVKGRHLFVKGEDDSRKFHIHMVLENSSLWDRYILFRDYLLKNDDAVLYYSKLKLAISKYLANDRNSYTKIKEPFIDLIISLRKKEILSKNENI